MVAAPPEFVHPLLPELPEPVVDEPALVLPDPLEPVVPALPVKEAAPEDAPPVSPPLEAPEPAFPPLEPVVPITPLPPCTQRHWKPCASSKQARTLVLLQVGHHDRQ